MVNTHQALMTLLKSAVTGQPLPLPEDLQPEAYEALIRSQSLTPIFYQGAFNCGLSMDTEFMERCKQQYLQALIRDQRQQQALDRLFHTFEEHGIDYLPLKGCVIKALYPQPEMRLMGDADVLIRLEQYPQIRTLMEQLGYQTVKETDHDYSWQRPELYVELHKHLVPASEKAAFRYFADPWSRAVHQSGHRYSLSLEEEYLFLFSHMTKHYQGRGIGTRHFLDLYLFRKAHPEMHPSPVADGLRQLQLTQFHKNVCALLDNWFEDGPETENTRLMTRCILSGGNFGDNTLMDFNLQIAGSSDDKPIRHSRLKAFLRLVFPPYSSIVSRYPSLMGKPYLYLPVWLFRAFRLVFFQQTAMGTQIKKLSRFSDDRINRRKAELQQVGLYITDPENPGDAGT